MQPRSSWASSVFRGGAVLLLAFLLGAVVHAQSTVDAACRKIIRYAPAPVAVGFQDKKSPSSDKKEPDKKESPPEYKWPTDVNGKDISAVMKDMDDKDPTIREFAARTLPLFGPPAQKEKVSELLIKRMKGEPDPGVKCAIYNTIGQIQFEKEAHNKEALDYLAREVDEAPTSSQRRVHAIQAIALFGPKGAPAITKLTGVAMRDPAYEVRRNIASALGRVGFNETTGPNARAQNALADVLASDVSASVRLEALQSLMLLGPPWAEIRKPNGPPPKIKTEEAAEIIKFMKRRVGDPKAKTPVVGAEKDKQVEIWARLVLMRFDPKEVNDDNIDAIARFLSKGIESAVRIQALNAMVIVGEMASKKLNDVVGVLEENDPSYQLTIASLNALMSMGAGAKPAMPNLKTMLAAREKDLKATLLKLAEKKDDPQLTAEKFTLEQLVGHLKAVIKHIDEAKSMSPAGMGTDPPKKP